MTDGLEDVDSSSPRVFDLISELDKQIQSDFLKLSNYESIVLAQLNHDAEIIHRTVSFAPALDVFSDQMNRKKISRSKTLKNLPINSCQLGYKVKLKIISPPISTAYGAYVDVMDKNWDSFPLYIRNWSPIIHVQGPKLQEYIKDCLDRFLAPGSNIILFDPWLTKSEDRRMILRCESPNTDLCLIDFRKRCQNYMHIDIDQLIRWSDQCSDTGDISSALEFLNDGLQQIDKKPDVDFFSQEHSCGEYEEYRFPLLYKRCICYLKAGQTQLALHDLNSLGHLDQLSTDEEKQLATMAVHVDLRLGNFEGAKYWMNSGFINPYLMPKLKKEMARLENEQRYRKYILQRMLRREEFLHPSSNSSPPLFGLQHYHLPKQRDDLFEIRSCSQEEIRMKGYPEGSYGVYALKNLETGTLLIVEAPFAFINNRSFNRKYFHSNMSKKDAKSFSLANEIEKQLSIGSKDPETLKKLKQIQSIRKWFEVRNTESTFPDDPSEEPFFTEVPNSYLMPWSLLVKAQQQNPFHSKLTTGLYPNGSMFNHSCLPNCLWLINDKYLFIYTGQSDIKEGDELTISYCPLWISSEKERSSQLKEFGIEKCQCELCSYDRSDTNQLDMFWGLSQKAKEKGLSPEERFDYVRRSLFIYDFLSNKYCRRPVGFINEFIELESLTELFKYDSNYQRQMFFRERQRSFLQRFANLTRFLIFDTSTINNPVLLFGGHLPLLLSHIKYFSSQMHPNQLELWEYILKNLYQVFTFNSCSSAHQMKDILNSHRNFFRYLYSTQTIFN